MNSPIWRLAGVGLLCLSLSAPTLADDNGQRSPQPEHGQQVQQQMQQQVQQQQRAQQQEQHGQQQQMQQQQRAQQQQLRGQQPEQRGQQQQQQQQTQWQQRQQEFKQRQAERVSEQQNRPQGSQAQAPQLGRQDPNGGRRDELPIQGKPGVAWQTQAPIRGNNEGPRGNYPQGRPDDRRGPGGNGWGPGPQYRPGYTIDRFPDREYRVPYRGQDFFYSGGYWYRPQGPRYVVVAPPYGIRTHQLPDYATRMWIGGAMFFLAAGTYYQYMDDSQDYVVVNPPQDVPQSQPQPVQGDGIDVTFYPANGQSPSQMEQDRYDCQRYAAQQSGFDPATATYAPAEAVAYQYRQNMGNCLVGRGYQVN